MQEGDLSQNKEKKYRIFLKEGENVVYGNIPWNSEMNAILKVNGYYETDYSKWLSPSVFYIPTLDDDLEAELTIKAISSYDVKKDEEQFYALDLKLLEEISNRIRKNEVTKLFVENGKIEAEVNAELGANLILTVPHDKNWRISLNGKTITANLFADCFYSIPLEKGSNTIEMTYLLPNKMLSIIMSVIGFGIVIYLMVRERDKYNE